MKFRTLKNYESEYFFAELAEKLNRGFSKKLVASKEFFATWGLCIGLNDDCDTENETNVQFFENENETGKYDLIIYVNGYEFHEIGTFETMPEIEKLVFIIEKLFSESISGF